MRGQPLHVPACRVRSFRFGWAFGALAAGQGVRDQDGIDPR